MTPGKNKALFLDRDGVINLYHPYICSQEMFHFQEGIFELCRDAQRLGYLVLVVTNQSGIARGYYNESQFLALTDWMVRKFSEEQIRIDRDVQRRDVDRAVESEWHQQPDDVR